MDEGPLKFKGKAVVTALYDGFIRLTTIALGKVDMCIQIHDIPDSFFHLIKSFASTVGEFIYTEPKSQDFEGNFFRVHTMVDVTKPLKNVVSHVLKKEHGIFRVKYERAGSPVGSRLAR